MASAQEIARITRIVRGMSDSERTALRKHLETDVPITVSGIPIAMMAFGKIAKAYQPIFQKVLDARSQRSAAEPAGTHHTHAWWP